MTNILDQLASRFDAASLLTGAQVTDRVTSFWDSAPTRAKAIVLPRSTDDVSFVMKACHACGQTIVVQGGLTGVVAGGVATDDDIILSLEKMTDLESIDETGSTATVQAGALLENVQNWVADKGFLFPLDLGARGSCTIGGNVATNAGGINVIRYGMMRNLVLGLEVVLPDGTILSSMNTMLKNNAGYDLKQLFIGTEGTLGIVTRIVLRLFPAPISSQSALVALNSFADVTRFLQLSQRLIGGNLSAFEVMWGNYFEAVTQPGAHRAPMARTYPYYVIFQAEGTDPKADERLFSTLLEQALEDGVIDDAILPKSESETRALWNIREDFSSLTALQPQYLYDVSLPIKDMGSYTQTVLADVKAKWPDGDCFVLGHIGDGNLHFFVWPNDPSATHRQADELVYRPLRAIGGSVSAEHGIGTEKVEWLSSSRSADEIALMRQLKQTFDPQQILNRGLVVGAPGN